MFLFGAVKNKFKNLKMFMNNMAFYMTAVICVGDIDTYTSLTYIYLFSLKKSIML